MTDELLSAWHEPGVLLLTFNRPEVLNAISVRCQPEGVRFSARSDFKHMAMRHAFRRRPIPEVFKGFLTSRRRRGA